MNKIIFIVVSVFFILLVSWYPSLMLSPGKLVAGHQDLTENCESCHDIFWGISNSKCITCHKLSEIGLRPSETGKSVLFHSKLENQQCTSCHTDHKGLIPSASLTAFDHILLPESERSKCISCHVKPADNLHKQISASCGSCHNNENWKSVQNFNHEMLTGFDKNNCVTCHKKPTDSLHSNFNSDCVKCHTTEKWTPASFDHSKYFVLDKNHNTKCITCHTGNNYKTYTCYNCHEHSESKIRDEHIEEGITNFNNCVSCHKSGNKHDIEFEGSGERKNSGDDD